MTQMISSYVTRVVAQAREQKLSPPRLPTQVRRSLIAIHGAVYPNLQPSAMWTDVQTTADQAIFLFNRRPPFGDFRLERDLSFISTRDLTDDERGPMLFLEALAWELAGSAMFFRRLQRELGGPGTFKLGMALGGLHDSLIDWAGFHPARENASQLFNWRFRPSQQTATYESSFLRFPMSDITTKAELANAVAGVIEMIARDVVGLRRSPGIGLHECRLELRHASVIGVVREALSQMGSTDRSQGPALARASSA